MACPARTRGTSLPASRHDRGFTLLEVMVAIVLLSIIMTTAYGALRLGARSWEAGVTRAVATGDYRTAVEIVQRQASQALAITWPDDATRPIAFTGEQDRCRFIAPAPQQYRQAGLFEYTLAVSASDTGKQLLLSYMPYRPGGSDFRNPDPEQQLILADGLMAVSIDYFGAEPVTGARTANAPAAWHRQWPAQAQQLPELVRIRVEAKPAGQQWPELIIPMRARRPS